MGEDEQQTPPKIVLRQSELYHIGDIILTFLKGDPPSIQVTLGEVSTDLSLDQAMELSVILEIWTKEYGKPRKKRRKEEE